MGHTQLNNKESQQISVKSLSGQAIKSIRVLGQNDKVKWQQSSDSIDIQLPKINNDTIGYALEISLVE